jgi:hypothetical protein
MELSAGVVDGVIEYRRKGESPVSDLLFRVCPVEN